MAQRYDYEMTDNGDIKITNNDFRLVPSDTQHVQDTINAHAGWWKENFTDGVGISNYLNSSGNQQELERSIKIQLQIDDYVVNNPSVFISGNQVKVQPNATRK
jgi:hypothetical protein